MNIFQQLITTTKMYGPKLTRDSVVRTSASAVSLCRFRSLFKRNDGLPDPKGSFSTCLSSHAIALANKEVEKVSSEKGIGKQRGYTNRERYGAPSHTPVLLQQLPPIFLYIRGSLECSKLFPTPPCQLPFCHE